MSWIPRIGAEFAGYRLDALLGSGGMSIVYRAQHLSLDRTVALKLLSPQLSDDAAFRERFLRESRSAAALDHPNIIPIYEAGEDQDVFYIAMRYVEGSDLKSVLNREGPLDAKRTVSIISQVAAALDVAHAKGLIHRDIKPANILIASRYGPDESDHVYLSDFGVAKFRSSPVLTKTGVFVGTVEYASPEQIEGTELDGRADVYALGCVLYECVTASMVYDKDSEVALMYAHLLEPPPSVAEKRQDLPPEIDNVIGKAMAKSRDERYATPREMSMALKQVLGSESVAAGTALPSQTQHGGETVLAGTPGAPGGPGAPTGPGLTMGSPSTPGLTTTSGESPPPRRKRPSDRVIAAILGVALLALGAVLAAVLLTGNDNKSSAGTTSGSTTTTSSGGPKTTHGLLAATPAPLHDGCTEESKPAAGAVQTLVCVPPANRKLSFYPDRWQLSSYKTAAELAAAYEAERKAHNVAPNQGRCDGTTWGGEGPWNHGPGKPGGRRLCYFDGDVAVMVWTHGKLGQASHLESLGIARAGGSNHPDLFNWWRFWHHRLGKCSEADCVAKLT